MSGKKYPTLSASLYVYTLIAKEITKNKSSMEALMNPVLQCALDAAEMKMMKFFDKSMAESEYYYIATCTLSVSLLHSGFC